jgi:hypothetical protein
MRTPYSVSTHRREAWYTLVMIVSDTSWSGAQLGWMVCDIPQNELDDGTEARTVPSAPLPRCPLPCGLHCPVQSLPSQRSPRLRQERCAVRRTQRALGRWSSTTSTLSNLPARGTRCTRTVPPQYRHSTPTVPPTLPPQYRAVRRSTPQYPAVYAVPRCSPHSTPTVPTGIVPTAYRTYALVC